MFVSGFVPSTYAEEVYGRQSQGFEGMQCSNVQEQFHMFPNCPRVLVSSIYIFLQLSKASQIIINKLQSFFSNFSLMYSSLSPCGFWEPLVDSRFTTQKLTIQFLSNKESIVCAFFRHSQHQNYWIIKLSCQFQGFNGLIKDFSKELSLFKTVTNNCFTLTNLVNYKSHIRNSFHKYQLQEYRQAGLLRVPLREYESVNFGPIYTMVENILNSV